MTEYKNYLENDGYVIIDGFINSQEIDKLREAANDAINLTRTHNWPHRRVVGKQFPPWTDEDSPDSWGVQHLMHPDLKMPIFREFYASDKLVELAANLVGCTPEYLQMELFNMLILPTRSSFNLSWHRDHVLHSADEQEEKNALTIPHYGVQFNAALYDDSCLWIVPQSHKMVRSPAQRALSCESKPADNPAEMPGAIQVHLNAGQILFYDANILHCAQYPCTPPSPPRATLHGSFGDLRGGSHRAIGVLQHGLEWMKDPSFGDGPGREMWEKLMEMYNQAKADDKLGKYSLNG